jgi:hypothetical protein
MSFGGGIQTVTLAAMSCLGDFEMPDYAVFADTQWETEETYAYLNWFIPWCAERGLTIHTTSLGSLRSTTLHDPTRGIIIPAWMKNKDGKTVPLSRQCTREYKIEPVRQKIRELCGVKYHYPMKTQVELWLGISGDEAHRMKFSRVGWMKNRYPFIELEMVRYDCELYLKKHDLPVPPKSACIGCPYHSNTYWENLKKNAPSDWADAVEFDEKLRGCLKKMATKAYLHPSCKPLKNFDPDGNSSDWFGNECEGFCGL